jgi:hypothetical protein
MLRDYKFTDEDKKTALRDFMVMTARSHMVRFHLCVKNYQIFLNLSVKLKLVLPGTTTGGIIGVVISGGPV